MRRATADPKHPGMKRLVLLVVCLAAASCGGGLERASFSADGVTFAHGERVGLTLTNVTQGQLKVNLCLSQLISADGKTTGPSEAASCDSLEPSPLEASKSVNARKSIPASLPAGRWRYETTITLPNEKTEKVLTQEFDVTN